jgi:hypothetical protein
MQQNALIDISKPRPADKPKRKPKQERERIDMIETPPASDWFCKATDPWGREIWFLRFQMTGFRTRRYGPFASKHKALLLLNRILGNLWEHLVDADDYLDELQMKPRTFNRRYALYPIVEDELNPGPVTEGA